MIGLHRTFICVCVAFIVYLAPAAGGKVTDVCRLSQDTGVCYALYIAWFYDSKVQECREFVYGGCGGNGNRFNTEGDCYARCQEKLIDLRPPMNVTIQYVQETQIYIYWHHPDNYKIHDVDNKTYTYLNMDGGQVSQKGSGVTHVLINPMTTLVPDKPTTSNVIGGDGTTLVAPNNESKILNTTTVNGNNTVELNGKANATVTTTTSPVGGNGTANDVTVKPGQINGTSNEGTTVKQGAVTGDPAGVHNGSSETAKNYTGRDKVLFHLAQLTNYIVSYRKGITDSWTNVTLPANQTELHVTPLLAETKYTFIVSARYAANTTISSPPIVVSTRAGHGQAANCHCDRFGTVGGYRACNFTLHELPWCRSNCHCDRFGTVGGYRACHLTLHELPWCQCKSGFTGLFCELCNNGFYRTALNMPPCHPCPCSKTASSGSCHFVEGYLHCTRCHDGYTGNLCQRCNNGYYRNRDVMPSQCTKCEGCHNERPGLICDPYSGKCINCHYNTTGHRCDKCLEGFVGDPMKNISCTAPVSSERYHPPNTGVIAAICVGIIIMLSAIVGLIVYCRMRNYPKHQPFWTVELNEGHDDVYFRSEDDETNDGDDNFGNSYRFKPTSKLAYQKLNT